MIFVEATVTRFPRDNYDNETMIEALAPYRRRLEAASMSMPAFNDAFFQALGVRSRGLFCDPFAPERWFDENAGQYPVAREAARTYLDLMAEREPLGADDKAKIETALKDARDHQKSESIETLQAKSAALSEASHKLAEKMYAQAPGAEDGPSAGAAGGQAGAGASAGGSKDNVVDAEFEEVKDPGKA